MTDKEKQKLLAKKLLELSMEEDRVSEIRVKAVLESVRDRNPRLLKPLLKQYMSYVSREINRSVAVVHYAGKPDDASINSLKDLLKREYDRDIDIECEENPELLAGLKINIADDVWDEDIATHLTQFRQA